MVNFREFSQSITKGLFMLVNGFIVLNAYCVLGFAVVDIKLLDQYGEEMANGSFMGDMAIILASLFLIIIAITGLIGAIKMNLKIMYLYISVLMLQMLMQMLMAVLVSLQRRGLQVRLSESIREDFFKNITLENRDYHENLWDTLQTKYECCGLNGPDDYFAIGQAISMSCCPRAFRARNAFAQKQLYKSCIESASYYSQGCEDELLYIIQSDGEWLLGAAVTCFWFEGGAMLLASWVANIIKNSVQVYQHTVKY